MKYPKFLFLNFYFLSLSGIPYPFPLTLLATWKHLRENKMLNLTILSFFITDLFIFIYNTALRFLNSHSIPSVNSDFLSIIDLSPEPYEIPLYLGLSLFLVLTIYLFYRVPDKSRLVPTIIKFILLILLFFVFIQNLGSYPMAGDTIFIPSPFDIKTSQVAVLIYSSFVLFLIFESEAIGRLSQRVFLILIMLVIAILTFEPRITYRRS